MNVALIERDEIPAAVPAPVTPMAMLDRAFASGASMETLEKLMGLQERWAANQARMAFSAAIAAAKAEIPIIAKNKAGHTNRYADFAAIAKVVDPVISKHGLSYRFRTKQDDRIHVTCVIRHEAGHEEENTLSGPTDTSGAKNAIQAIGSTLTYLQRYTLTQALGLAASDDDDGKTAGAGGSVTDEQADAIRDLAVQVGANMDGFLRRMKVESVPDIPARDYQRAIDLLETKRAKS
jgi:hypothetical protein